jgi:hypothetical protein
MLMTVLVLLAVGVFAAGQDGTSDPEKVPEQQEVKKKTGQQESIKEDQRPDWPRPYKPTEEISADSIVPFPADI